MAHLKPGDVVLRADGSETGIVGIYPVAEPKLYVMFQGGVGVNLDRTAKMLVRLN